MELNHHRLFPTIEPFTKQTLKAGNLHEIYYEVCGNPTGKPVVFLHGGPGSGCSPTQRRFFDPVTYRIILIDQRGCGRSQPLGETRQNTTDDLVSDIEAVRLALNIDQWLVFGGSWGSTLALCYAVTYPQYVAGLILRGIFLSRPSELSWFLGDVRLFYPDQWQALCHYLPDNQRHNPIAAYEKLIFSDDFNISIPASIQWNAFESSIMSLLPRPSNNDNAEVNGEVELARARIQIHYIQHHCFIGERNLLAEAKSKLSNIPTHIIQGRYDMVCPPITAWELAQAMPHATFNMVSDAGHSAIDPSLTSALLAATEQFKHLI